MSHSKLDSLGAVWVVSLMWFIAVHTTDQRVDACGTFLAGREVTRVLTSVVGASTNGTAGVISAEGSGVSVSLTVVALCAPTVCDIVIQLTFTVAYNEIWRPMLAFLTLPVSVITIVEYVLCSRRSAVVNQRGV